MPASSLGAHRFFPRSTRPTFPRLLTSLCDPFEENEVSKRAYSDFWAHYLISSPLALLSSVSGKGDRGQTAKRRKASCSEFPLPPQATNWRLFGTVGEDPSFTAGLCLSLTPPSPNLFRMIPCFLRTEAQGPEWPCCPLECQWPG